MFLDSFFKVFVTMLPIRYAGGLQSYFGVTEANKCIRVLLKLFSIVSVVVF